MTVEENKEVVRKAYSSITEGNLDGFFDCLTDDVKWTFIGTRRFGRSFVGKEDITNNLFGPLGEILEGTIRIGIKSLTAEGQRVVMEAEGKSSTKTGGAYNNTYCIVLDLEGGKIANIQEYLDTELVTEVFGQP